MQELSATRSLYEATAVLKEMQLQATELAPVHELGRAALKTVLEECMRTCVHQYLWEANRRGQADRRNGYYRRWLMTSMGAIELAVPRTRTYNPVRIIRAYARREAEVDRLILACFVLGLSTRKVGAALLTILGERVSATTVSRVAKQLDAAVEAFLRRPLANRYRALLLDGVVRDVAEGLITVELASGARVVASASADGDAPARGGRVHVAYRPEDVVLALPEDAGVTSAINGFAVRVGVLMPAGGLVRVRLEGEVGLTALVTRRSAESLGLAPGRRVIAQVKATALRAYRMD